MKTQIIYSLPVRKVDFTIAVSDSRAHHDRTKHAVDFPLPEGTPITAAADGVVINIQIDSNEGGNTEKYKNNINKYMNWITIQHGENEYSQPSHLMYQSAKVKVGDKVKRGEIIALSGNTGYSTQPHLHFQVVRFFEIDGKKDWESIEIKWDKSFEVLRR